MSGRSIALIALISVIVGFGVLSGLALMDVGYLGIFEPHFSTWGGAQVFTDLVILALLSCVWMVRDATGRALPAWPFLLITLVGGSFGVLLYLVAREFYSAPGRGRIG